MGFFLLSDGGHLLLDNGGSLLLDREVAEQSAGGGRHFRVGDPNAPHVMPARPGQMIIGMSVMSFQAPATTSAVCVLGDAPPAPTIADFITNDAEFLLAMTLAA